MQFNHKYPFLYLLAALAGGILCGAYFTLPLWVAAATSAGIAGGILLARTKNPRLQHFAWAGTDILLLATIFYIGNTTSRHTPQTYEPESVYWLEARCEEELNGNNYILSANGDRFYLSRFYIDTTYHAGDSLSFYTRILPFRHNANPYEFSYARYMEQQGVHHRLRPLSPPEPTGKSHTVASFFNAQRAKLLEKTMRLTDDTTCIRLVNALCLGYRNDMQKELNDLFIRTGTVHLLSVSGLHVGAIFGLLLFIFRRLRLSRQAAMLLALPLLWGYACLTGLDPAVVRAATILSFYAVSRMLCRTYNPVNILSASAVLTLLAEPSALYSLSFLLSYSAYGGIMLLYPYLFRLPGKLPKIPSQIYACICLTLAAQIPTLPICAYYFHTLNANGFLANLIAVPLSTLLLYAAAACLALPAAVGQILMPACEILSCTLTGSLQALAPYIVNLKDLYPTALSVALIYGMIFCFGYYLLKHKSRYLQATAGLACLLLIATVLANRHTSSRREIVIFHHHRQSAIALNYNGFCLPLKSPSDSLLRSAPYVLRNKLQMLPAGTGSVADGFSWQPPRLCLPHDTLLIAAPGTPAPASAGILIVTGNLYPRQLFGDGFRRPYPRQIILDGSNHAYCSRAWEKFCARHRLALLHTAEEGAIYLPIK